AHSQDSAHREIWKDRKTGECTTSSGVLSGAKPSMSYNPVTSSDAENGAKSGAAPVSVFIHRHTCTHCGKACEREIAPEMFHQHTFPYHPPRSAWHAVHSQSVHYTMNVLLVAIVIFMTFIAAKFLFGK
ncbi:hypothetical protein PENTCL1PPCAC_8313, partial [Pristionchus entomophagus]